MLIVEDNLLGNVYSINRTLSRRWCRRAEAPARKIGAGSGVDRGGEFLLIREGVPLEQFKKTLAERSDYVDLRACVKEAADGGGGGRRLGGLYTWCKGGCCSG
jgi:hypothetical protein